MPMRRSILRNVTLLSILGVCLSGWLPVDATTLRLMRLDEIAARADRVVHAEAIEQRVYWDHSGRKIYTDTTFEVIESIKGAGPARLTVTILGGAIGPVAMVVDGAPLFAIGEEVVLFTSPRPDGRKNLIGYSQGVLRVHVDVATGARSVGPARARSPLSEVLLQLERLVEVDREPDDVGTTGFRPIQEQVGERERQP